MDPEPFFRIIHGRKPPPEPVTFRAVRWWFLKFSVVSLTFLVLGVITYEITVTGTFLRAVFEGSTIAVGCYLFVILAKPMLRGFNSIFDPLRKLIKRH